jgi:hypothetical protein
VKYIKKYRLFEDIDSEPDYLSKLRKQPHFQEIGNTTHDIFIPLYEYGFEINIHPINIITCVPTFKLKSKSDIISFIIKNPIQFYPNAGTMYSFHYEECQEEVEQLDKFMKLEGYKLEQMDPSYGSKMDIDELVGESIFNELILVYSK